MKKILIIILIFNFSIIYSQKKEELFFLSNKVGFSEYSLENNFKLNALNYSVNIGKEFNLNKSYSVLTSLGLDNYYFNVNENSDNLYIKTKFVNLPIGIRIYTSKVDSSRFYSGLSIVNKYKIDESIENFAESIETKGENGYNLGGFAEFGYRTTIKENLDFYIGLEFYSDLLQSGYTNKTIINNQINLIIGIDVFKK